MLLRKRIVVIAVCLAPLAACKPTGSAGTNDGNAPLATENVNDKAQRVTGRAQLIAPIQHAHVKVSRLALGVPDEFISETTTDDKGEFDVTLPQPTNGDLLIEVLGDNGGATLEPVTSVTPITLSESDRLMAIAVATKIGDETNVSINPLSTLVAARSLSAYRNGSKLGEAVAKNIDLFSAHFQTASPWLAQPFDLTAGEAPGLSSGVILGLALIGMSQHALELGTRAGVSDVSVVNSLVLLRLLVADLQDGVFDGRNGSAALKVVGNVFIDQDTTRLAWARAMETWLDSEQNKTGLSKRDATQIVGAVRSDVSELYPPSEMAPQELPETQQSGAPPSIVLTTPKDNQTIGPSDLITGYLEDADGVSSLTLSLDGAHVLIPIDTTNGNKWTFAFPPQLMTGSHVLEVVARDSKTNESTKQVSFSYDSTGPSVSLVQCVAPDDRVRAATVNAGGATFADTTAAAGCTEGALSDGTQQFYTLADLYDEGTRAPFITLSITDQAFASATYVVKQNDVVVFGPTGLPTASTGPATHVVALSNGVLSVAATSIHAADALAIEVTATDENGNSTTRAFKFQLTLMPTPLYIQETPADSAYRLDSHTFAADNVQDLFHHSFDASNIPVCGSYSCQAFPGALIQVTKFAVVNVSPRPITMPTDWAVATQGSMSFQRTAYRSHVLTGLNYALGPNPCAEITEVDVFNDYSPYVPNYATQVCHSYSEFKKGKNTESIMFTLLPRA